MLLHSFQSKTNKFTDMDMRLSSSDEREEAGDTEQTPIEALGLVMLFGLVNRIASKICSSMTSGEKGCKPALNRLIPALSVFCDWASANSNYLTTQTTQTIDESYTYNTAILAKSSFVASAELMKHESRMRATMSSSMAHLVDVLEKDMDRNKRMNQPDGGDSDTPIEEQTVGGKKKVYFLKEHVELRGKKWMVEFRA